MVLSYFGKEASYQRRMLLDAGRRGLSPECPSGCERSPARPAAGRSRLRVPRRECRQGPRFSPSFRFLPMPYTRSAPTPNPCHDHKEVTPCAGSFTTDGEGRQLSLRFSFLGGAIPSQFPQAGSCSGDPGSPSVGKLGCHPERSSAEKATKVCFGPLRL